MKVPLLDVNAQNLPLEEELTVAFTRVLRSGRFILGGEVEAFENSVAGFVGARYAVGMSSGTDALLVALMALDVGPGDEVLCPSFTFFATAGCVARTGATPVFVDSCPVCFNIDVAAAAEKVTARTKAVIAVHLFGQSADMDGVMVLAQEHGLKVIEDAAQAIGARFDGRGCGTVGDLGTYSFFPSKNLGGLGDGGMLVTGDADLAERCRVLRAHGSRPKYYHHLVGGNFRIDALQAALLGVKLKRYDGYTSARQENAARYAEMLSQTGGVEVADTARCCRPGGGGASVGGGALVLPTAAPRRDHIWNQYTLRVPGEGRRDALRAHLTAAGIGSEIYYPLTMDQQECFAGLPDASRGGVPVAHRLASEVLSIPVFPELGASQAEEVVAALQSFLKTAP